MEKLDLQTPNFTDENIQKLSELFPNCVTEGSNGKAIDFDTLKQELSSNIIEGNKECYQLTWPGKAESLVTANKPINKTLRPNREESKDFDNTENLYIEGDNLEVLKLLQETYLGKIKMIYIDPPYNTGKDFVYKDNFTQDKAEYDEKSGNIDDEGGRLISNPDSNGRYHSDWLSMMYPRLKLARNLLKDDGVIFISIDDNEVHNLRKICDEVFGESNFIANFTWKTRQASGKQVSQNNTSIEHEYILCYQKDMVKFIGVPRKRESYTNPDNDPRGDWAKHPLDVGSTRSERPNCYYDLIDPDTGNIYHANPNRVWSYAPESMNRLLSEGKILFNPNGNTRPYLKKFWTDLKTQFKPISSWLSRDAFNIGYNTEGTKSVNNLFNGKIFDYPKPESIIKLLVKQIAINDKDIVLDLFSGSSTTAHAVMQLNSEDNGNRKFIMAQIPEATDKKSEAYKANYKTIAEIGKERIRRAGEKIKKDNADKEDISDLDVGFRVLKVDSSNMKDVYFSPDNTSQDDMFDRASNIKDHRSDEDLLFMVLLDWGIDFSVKIERREVAGKTVYFADDDFLAACFTENLDEDFVKALVTENPLKVVLRDNGFDNDSVKINVEQIFKQANIEVKVI
jgi:adenine-specific DNA-methyltransferase